MADDLVALIELDTAKDALVAAEVARAKARDAILRSDRFTRTACWSAYNEATAEALTASGDYLRLCKLHGVNP